eukprot:s20_g48.t1
MIGDESVGSFEVVSDDVPPRDGHATSSMPPPSSGSNRRPSGGPALRSLRLMGEMEKETGKITGEDEGEKRADMGSASNQEVKIQEDEESAAASNARAATSIPEGVLPEGELPVPEGGLPEGALPEGEEDEGLDKPVVKEKKYRRVRKRKVKTEDPGEEALPPSSSSMATKVEPTSTELSTMATPMEVASKMEPTSMTVSMATSSTDPTSASLPSTQGTSEMHPPTTSAPASSMTETVDLTKGEASYARFMKGRQEDRTKRLAALQAMKAAREKLGPQQGEAHLQDAKVEDETEKNDDEVEMYVVQTGKPKEKTMAKKPRRRRTGTIKGKRWYKRSKITQKMDIPNQRNGNRMEHLKKEADIAKRKLDLKEVVQKKAEVHERAERERQRHLREIAKAKEEKKKKEQKVDLKPRADEDEPEERDFNPESTILLIPKSRVQTEQPDEETTPTRKVIIQEKHHGMHPPPPKGIPGFHYSLPLRVDPTIPPKPTQVGGRFFPESEDPSFLRVLPRVTSGVAALEIEDEVRDPLAATTSKAQAKAMMKMGYPTSMSKARSVLMTMPPVQQTMEAGPSSGHQEQVQQEEPEQQVSDEDVEVMEASSSRRLRDEPQHGAMAAMGGGSGGGDDPGRDPMSRRDPMPAPVEDDENEEEEEETLTPWQMHMMRQESDFLTGGYRPRKRPIQAGKSTCWTAQRTAKREKGSSTSAWTTAGHWKGRGMATRAEEDGTVGGSILHSVKSPNMSWQLIYGKGLRPRSLWQGSQGGKSRAGAPVLHGEGGAASNIRRARAVAHAARAIRNVEAASALEGAGEIPQTMVTDLLNVATDAIHMVETADDPIPGRPQAGVSTGAGPMLLNYEDSSTATSSTDPTPGMSVNAWVAAGKGKGKGPPMTVDEVRAW